METLSTGLLLNESSEVSFSEEIQDWQKNEKVKSTTVTNGPNPRIRRDTFVAVRRLKVALRIGSAGKCGLACSPVMYGMLLLANTSDRFDRFQSESTPVGSIPTEGLGIRWAL
jgi:hypothetical protein